MENNTGKYLKYAIGEIVLVVIGILIALQINNWNEIQKTKRWEDQFLTDLQNELQNDLNQLSTVYHLQINKEEASKLAMQLIKRAQQEDKAKIDSIFSSTQKSNRTFFPTTGVYDSGLSGGKIEQLSNDSLKYAIMNLYNHFYKRLVYNGEVLDDVVEHVDWEKIPFYDESEEKTRSWEALTDFKFLALIDYQHGQNQVYNTLAKANLEEIKRVILMIEEERRLK